MGSSSDERWFTVEEDGFRLMGRRAGNEPLTVVWMGRAKSDELEQFIFDIGVNAYIKATAWKGGAMIEVEELTSLHELAAQLEREHATFEGARFVRFETQPEKVDGDATNKRFVVWSRQGPLEPAKPLSRDGVEGVGVYLCKSMFSSVKDKLIAFVCSTYRSGRRGIDDGVQARKTVCDLLTQLERDLVY